MKPLALALKAGYRDSDRKESMWRGCGHPYGAVLPYNWPSNGSPEMVTGPVRIWYPHVPLVGLMRVNGGVMTQESNILAPQVGFEPTTDQLTADCSTTELLQSVVRKRGYVVGASDETCIIISSLAVK